MEQSMFIEYKKTTFFASFYLFLIVCIAPFSVMYAEGENNSEEALSNTIHDALYNAADQNKLSLLKKIILTKKVDVNHSLANEKNYTPLHIATIRGHVEIIKYLIKSGADVNVTAGKLSITPLYLAIYHGQLESLRILIGNGALFEFQSNQAIFSIIIHLLEKSEFDLLIYLFESGMPINFIDEKGYTLLHHVIEKGNQSLLTYLLRAGLDPRLADTQGVTPLHIACLLGDVYSIKNLLAYGADLRQQDKKGNLPLFYALPGGIEALRYLLQQGANINARDSNGNSLLMLAIAAGKIEIARMLVLRGIDLNIRNSKNETAIRVAYKKKLSSFVRYLHKNGASTDSIQDLIARQNKLDRGLIEATKKSNIKHIRKFLTKGASINTVDERGYSLLHLAVIENRADILVLFIKLGANVNIVDENDDTPLHKAISMKNVAMTQFLLAQKEINIKIQNKFKETPLSLAKKRELSEISEIIKNYMDQNNISDSY